MRRSVGVSAVAGRRSAADPGELGTSPGGPEGRAKLLEDPERLLKGPPRGRLLSRPPLDLALREQRAGELERLRDPSMLLEGALEHERSRRGIAARGEQQRPASRRCRERPWTPGRSRLVLELLQQLGGGVKVSHADLRLDRVGVYRDDARLPDAHLAQEP